MKNLSREKMKATQGGYKLAKEPAIRLLDFGINEGEKMKLPNFLEILKQ